MFAERPHWRVRVRLVGLALVVGVGGCALDIPFDLSNRPPHILSVTVFPTVIGPADSVTVTISAIDRDGDTLVYDWITDGRLRIKGAIPGDHSLYNTYENSRVFYPDFVRAPVDTPWVDCSARDGRGSSDGRIIRFIVRQ